MRVLLRILEAEAHKIKMEIGVGKQVEQLRHILPQEINLGFYGCKNGIVC